MEFFMAAVLRRLGLGRPSRLSGRYFFRSGQYVRRGVSNALQPPVQQNYRGSVVVDTLFLLIKISLPKRVEDAKDQIQWEEGLSRRVATQDNQHK
jgi:hypothetical protein